MGWRQKSGTDYHETVVFWTVSDLNNDLVGLNGESRVKSSLRFPKSRVKSSHSRQVTRVKSSHRENMTRVDSSRVIDSSRPNTELQHSTTQAHGTLIPGNYHASTPSAEKLACLVERVVLQDILIYTKQSIFCAMDVDRIKHFSRISRMYHL